MRLQAGHHALERVVEVDGRDRVAAGAGRADRGLVADVLQVGARQAGRRARDGAQLDGLVDRLVAHVHVEDLLARHQVGRRDVDLTVEAPGPQQRGVERVEPVGRRHDHDVRAVEAVQLDEQLVERLILLAVEADVLARRADGVQLVDEDDRGRVLARRVEQLADARGAQPGEHLDEGRGRLREEGRARLGRDRLREQRLAGARRPVQQHAAGNASAQALEASGIAQELDDLGELGLGLLDAGDVVPAHDRLLVGLELGRRRARHHLHEPPHQVHQEPQQERRDPEDDEERGSGRRRRPATLAIVDVSTSLCVGRNRAELEPVASGRGCARQRTRSSRGFGR